MAEHHTRQNNAGGSSWGGPRYSTRGGVAHVGASDTIALDGCWCGEPQGHDWPGKNDGAPHPRQRLSDKQEDVVTMTAEPKIQLSRKEIGGFSKAIQDLLLEIVNDHGVKYRRIDGSHILLFPPDGESRPFKVSAARTDEVNTRILEVQFMEAFGIKRPEQKKPAREPEKPKPVPKPRPVAEKPPAPAPAPPAKAPAPTPEPTGDLESAVRDAITLLHTALGVEDEAIKAIVEVDGLRAALKAKEDEVAQLRKELDSEKRESSGLRIETCRLDNLVTEHMERADRLEAALKPLRALLKGDG